MGIKYDWNPEDYEKNSLAQHSWAREIISKLELAGNERILDIGCGDGKNTAEIARCVPDGSVLGIDSCEEMIFLAQARYPSTEYKNLEFNFGDASNLNFDKEFDLVVSFACLHWVKNHVPILAGIKNGLKSNGKTFLQFGGKGNGAGLFNAAEKVTTSNKWSEYFQGFTFPYAFYEPYEYVKWIENVGLRTRRVELIPKYVVHNDKESLKGWIRTTWLPYLERIPKNKHDEFISDIVDGYLIKYPPDERGLINTRMMRLEVETIKR